MTHTKKNLKSLEQFNKNKYQSNLVVFKSLVSKASVPKASASNSIKNSKTTFNPKIKLFFIFSIIILMTSILSYNVISDSPLLISTSNPKPTLKVRFAEPVSLISWQLTKYLDNENLSLVQIQNIDNTTYLFRPVNDLVQDNYHFQLYAKDFLNNIGLTTKDFNVNFSFVVQLVTPRYGFSQNRSFPITFSTSQNATCKYSLDFVPKIWSAYNNFDTTSETLHKISNFTINPSITIQKMYVICNTSYGQLLGDDGKFLFYFSVDTTPPVITSLIATPNPVSDCVYSGGQCLLKSTLSVTTSKPTNCRYDTSAKGYEDMPVSSTFSSTSSYSIINKQNFTYDLEGNYNYFVACEDQNTPPQHTIAQSISIYINSSLPLQITSTGPTGAFSDAYLLLTATTNKVTNCSFFNSDGSYLGTSYITVDHSITYFNNKTGTQNIIVNCSNRAENAIGAISFLSDKTAPYFIYINDSTPLGTDPQRTNSQNKLWINFLAADNESGINSHNAYRYRIEQIGTANISTPISSWYEVSISDSGRIIYVTPKDLSGSTTDLANGSYRFLINATNSAGLSKLDYSDGIRVDTSYVPFLSISCNDGVKNQGESDIDCGGTSTCQKCVNGDDCIINQDCISTYCNASNKICIQNPCLNGKLDTWNKETDVDCGGNCLLYNKTCNNGQICNLNPDCGSSYCNSSNKICVVSPCSNGIMDKWNGETGIDCGGQCLTTQNKKCPLGQGCTNNNECTSGYCNPLKVCSIPSCTDTFKNGDESGVDCGGSCVNKCVNNVSCIKNSDCVSMYCDKASYKCKDDPDKDTDGDGLPDWWEIQNGLNPFDPSDATKIDSITGKSYKETYKKYIETIKNQTGGIPPSTIDDTGGFSFMSFLLIVIVLGILGAMGYYVYDKYYATPNKQKQSQLRQSQLGASKSQGVATRYNSLSSLQGMNQQTSTSPLSSSSQQRSQLGSAKPQSPTLISRTSLPNQKPLSPQLKQLIAKKKEEKVKARSNTFTVFGKGESTSKTNPNVTLSKTFTSKSNISKSPKEELRKFESEEDENTNITGKNYGKKQQSSTNKTQTGNDEEWVDVKKLKSNEPKKQPEKSKNIFDQIADFAGFGDFKSEDTTTNKNPAHKNKENESSEKSNFKDGDKIFEELDKIAKKKK